MEKQIKLRLLFVECMAVRTLVSFTKVIYYWVCEIGGL